MYDGREGVRYVDLMMAVEFVLNPMREMSMSYICQNRTSERFCEGCMMGASAWAEWSEIRLLD